MCVAHHERDRVLAEHPTDSFSRNSPALPPSFPPNADLNFEEPTPLIVGQSVTAYHKKAKLQARG